MVGGGGGQVEVVVRTLKLVLREFQRRWMKSEQSSSERVRARRATLDALVLVVVQLLQAVAVAAAAAAAVEVHTVALMFFGC